MISRQRVSLSQGVFALRSGRAAWASCSSLVADSFSQVIEIANVALALSAACSFWGRLLGTKLYKIIQSSFSLFFFSSCLRYQGFQQS